MELLLVLCAGIALAAVYEAIRERRRRKRDRWNELDKRLHQYKG